jgi:hypothetical protein
MKDAKNVPVLILPDGISLAVDEQGFATLPTNKVVVRDSEGREILATVGHRKRFEEVTLPDGRVTSAKVVHLWLRPEGPPPGAVRTVQAAAKPAETKAKGKSKAKAAETAPAPAPAPSVEDRIGRLEALIMQLASAK